VKGGGLKEVTKKDPFIGFVGRGVSVTSRNKKARGGKKSEKKVNHAVIPLLGIKGVRRKGRQ